MGIEEALDVERVYATYPNAAIDLVLADNNSWTDMMAAVQEAARLPNVVAVSMSWGGQEVAGESQIDSYFENPAPQNVTYVASTGDFGPPSEYPAYSQMCSPLAAPP